MYDFDGDVATIYTGATDIGKTGLLATYNRSPKLPVWDLPCGDVSDSSDGTKFPSFIQLNDSLRFYRKSLCRPMTLVSFNFFSKVWVKFALVIAGQEYRVLDKWPVPNLFLWPPSDVTRLNCAISQMLHFLRNELETKRRGEACAPFSTSLRKIRWTMGNLWARISASVGGGNACRVVSLT